MKNKNDVAIPWDRKFWVKIGYFKPKRVNFGGSQID